MRILHISIERNGIQVPVGIIRGNMPEDAAFQYDPLYLKSAYAVAISLSLPLQAESFSVQKTACYFEGLLPEGFSRRSVAQYLHTDEDNYLSILSGLGRECLGAVQVTEDGFQSEPAHYEKLSGKEVKALAEEGVSKSTELVTKAHLSLTGASGKVGLYYGNDHQWYLPKGTAPSTHIVKQSHIRLRDIITNEQLCLLTAEKAGLTIPHSFIVNTGNGREDEILFATERYDRRITASSAVLDGLPVPFRLHQEDMAQALGIFGSHKYETEPHAYFSRMCQLIRENSDRPVEDLESLWKLLIFHYLCGNTDGHIKNISLLYNESLSGLCLSPVYDIISTVIYPSGSRDMALFIGSTNHFAEITKQNFIEEAHKANLNIRKAMQIYQEMLRSFAFHMDESAAELKAAGYLHADEIKEKILTEGGYAHLQQKF